MGSARYDGWRGQRTGIGFPLGWMGTLDGGLQGGFPLGDPMGRDKKVHEESH